MCGPAGGESMHGELTLEGSESVALVVREELARRRLSRQWLADEARVSLSTLEKALAGSRRSLSRRSFGLRTHSARACGQRRRRTIRLGCSLPKAWALTLVRQCSGSKAP